MTHEEARTRRKETQETFFGVWGLSVIGQVTDGWIDLPSWVSVVFDVLGAGAILLLLLLVYQYWQERRLSQVG